MDITGPDLCIESTVLNNGYANASGTSFSAPHVTGAVALLKAKQPNWSEAEIRDALLKHAEAGPVPGDPDFPEPIVNVQGF